MARGSGLPWKCTSQMKSDLLFHNNHPVTTCCLPLTFPLMSGAMGGCIWVLKCLSPDTTIALQSLLSNLSCLHIKFTAFTHSLTHTEKGGVKHSVNTMPQVIGGFKSMLSISIAFLFSLPVSTINSSLHGL